MAVEVNTSGIFQAGIPSHLFKVPPGVLFWDVSSDGKRFVMASSVHWGQPGVHCLNWQSALESLNRALSLNGTNAITFTVVGTAAPEQPGPSAAAGRRAAPPPASS